ncbi:MAG: hypothetical protein WD066_12765 [Planctomycetaceae bacterium]
MSQAVVRRAPFAHCRRREGSPTGSTRFRTTVAHSLAAVAASLLLVGTAAAQVPFEGSAADAIPSAAPLDVPLPALPDEPVPPHVSPIDPKPIGEVRADIRVRMADDEGQPLELPANIAAEPFLSQPLLDPFAHDRVWTECGLCAFPYYFHHQPLYFEDANLERCGLAHGCCQPLFSTVHFLGTIPLLPYKMGAQHPRELVCATPDCAPGCRYGCGRNLLGPTVPTCSTKGFLVQGLAVTGLVFLIP